MNVIEQINNILEEGLLKGAYPGGAYGLIYKGKIYTHTFGVKSKEPFMPLKGDELYDVASLTKVIATSTLIHKYLEKGIITLDTSVSDILKYYPYPIQIRELLSHSSGLPAYLTNANDFTTKEEVINAIMKAKPIYEKNTKVVYSCVGFILLGHILETISNKSLDTLAKEEIFNPLKMHHSTYKPDITRAVPTEFRDDKGYKGLLVGKVHDGLSFAQGGLSGNAGLFSNVEDLVLFMKSILDKKFVLGEEALNLIFQSTIQIDEDKTNRSLGWAKPYGDKDQIIMHTGFTGCNMWIDRKQNIAFVLLTNAIHPKRENNKIFGYRQRIYDLFHA